MNVLDSARVIIYRLNKKGLEIFLVKNQQDVNQWQLPEGLPSNEQDQRIIHLESEEQKGYAFEADWHEIPSIRGMLKDDARLVKAELKKRIPELEQGSYVAVKEAFKKVLPAEYALLKELKEILFERNQAGNI